MTGLEKLLKANRWRIRTGQYGSDETAGWNGAFLVPLEGEMWHIMLGDGMGWQHLSISNAQRKIMPSWNVMCRVKEAFFADEDWVVQFHPAKADYVNDHPFTLHLWRPLNEPLPVPYVYMV
jgi:hypothetical protein